MDERKPEVWENMDVHFKHPKLFARIRQLIRDGKIEILKRRLDLIEKQVERGGAWKNTQ